MFTFEKQKCKALLPVKNVPFEKQKELTLLGLVIWGEARGESRLGQYAVGFTILNRWKKQSWYGKSISEVITLPYQFSCMNPKDPNRQKMERLKNIQSWRESIRIAHRIYTYDQETLIRAVTDDKRIQVLFREAMHFHTKQITPFWASAFDPLGDLGNHIFYK
jgi:spore germination cell wall hydrolase CwlJ-like protein